MEIKNFEFLQELTSKGVIVLYRNTNYAEAIYSSNIPYRPGVYLVYSLNEKGEDKELLYYGKAGVTNNSGTPYLNFHQLPKRLVATAPIPSCHPEFEKNKKITRATLWPWYVENIYIYGIKIYWFVTEWPKHNPNDFEKKIKLQIKQKCPKWKKSI
jgi:hypothetical protein